MGMSSLFVSPEVINSSSHCWVTRRTAAPDRGCRSNEPALPCLNHEPNYGEWDRFCLSRRFSSCIMERLGTPAWCDRDTGSIGGNSMDRKQSESPQNPWQGWRPSSRYGGGGMRYNPDEIRSQGADPGGVLGFSWLIDDEVAGHGEPRSPEDLAWLYEKGIRALVRMSENPRVTPQDIESAGLTDLHEPVPDFEPPSQEQLRRMAAFVMESAWTGKPVGVSCGAGKGRTGTVLACYLAERNLTAKGHILQVRRRRPGTVETEEQIEAVDRFIQHKLKTA